MTYKKIKTLKQYNKYCKIYEALFETEYKKDQDELELLEVLIEDYDRRVRNRQSQDLDPVQLLKSLLDNAGYTQKEFAKKIQISSQLLSDVLNYRRNISKSLVIKLSDFFSMRQEAFSRHYRLSHLESMGTKEVVKEVPVEIVREIEVIKEIPAETIRDLAVEVRKEKPIIVSKGETELKKVRLSNRKKSKLPSKHNSVTTAKRRIGSQRNRTRVKQSKAGANSYSRTKNEKGKKLLNSLDELDSKVAVTRSSRYERDDLTKIKGIGIKIQQILHGAGILTYQDLSKITLGSLKKLLLQSGMSEKRYNPKDWSKLAKKLSNKSKI